MLSIDRKVSLKAFCVPERLDDNSDVSVSVEMSPSILVLLDCNVAAISVLLKGDQVGVVDE